MSALDGLTHEEVAGRLDTTVETTRSLLARARENLRRTAAARETACVSVCDALDEAAASRRARLRARPPACGRCTDCRAVPARPARGPRAGCAGSRPGARGASSPSCWAAAGPRPCRRSPWAPAARSSASAGRSPCPEIAVDSRHLPEIAAAVPVPVAPEDGVAPQACGGDQGRADPGGAGRGRPRTRPWSRTSRRPPQGRERHEGRRPSGRRRVSAAPRRGVRRARVPARSARRCVSSSARTRAWPSATRCSGCCASCTSMRPGSAGGACRALTQLHKRVQGADVRAEPPAQGHRGDTRPTPTATATPTRAAVEAGEPTPLRAVADPPAATATPRAVGKAGARGDRRTGRDPRCANSTPLVVDSTPSLAQGAPPSPRPALLPLSAISAPPPRPAPRPRWPGRSAPHRRRLHPHGQRRSRARRRGLRAPPPCQGRRARTPPQRNVTT